MNITPTRKVTGAGAAGALSVIVVWIVGLFGVEVPPEVASAATTVFAFAGGFLVREA